MGCEARIGGIGKVKSFCTIWMLSVWCVYGEEMIYLLQTGYQSCEQAWPLFTELVSYCFAQEEAALLVHRLAICKCSEHIIICVEFHCWWLRQDGRFWRCKSRLDFGWRLTRCAQAAGVKAPYWKPGCGSRTTNVFSRPFSPIFFSL
jgi:hypothetical protein